MAPTEFNPPDVPTWAALALVGLLSCFVLACVLWPRRYPAVILVLIVVLIFIVLLVSVGVEPLVIVPLVAVAGGVAARLRPRKQEG
ncbi:hypothetical protein ACFP2T_37545 [Plantactinospora solaniradicis]|uniref:Uncharacterized protein n=1 Tax=Plantactinospora solaniradicis TaxID=1723736 RepID=A0ABW1KJ96_9ACTN